MGWPRSNVATSIEMFLLLMLQKTDFCRKVVTKQDGRSSIKFRHVYYAQVQGQIAITDRKWCDFVVYTSKGISIEKIKFN